MVIDQNAAQDFVVLDICDCKSLSFGQSRFGHQPIVGIHLSPGDLNKHCVSEPKMTPDDVLRAGSILMNFAQADGCTCVWLTDAAVIHSAVGVGENSRFGGMSETPKARHCSPC